MKESENLYTKVLNIVSIVVKTTEYKYSMNKHPQYLLLFSKLSINDRYKIITMLAELVNMNVLNTYKKGRDIYCVNKNSATF